MPSGVYERSQEHLEKMRQVRIGRKATPETLARMSEAQKGKTISPETRAKIKASLTGRKRPPETVAKMSAAAKGKKMPDATKQKISAANRGKRMLESHPGWKGDDAGYAGLHSWMNRNYPKSGVCEHCSVEATTRAHDYASIGHTYTRDRGDWLELCVRCHKRADAEFLRNRENGG